MASISGWFTRRAGLTKTAIVTIASTAHLTDLRDFHVRIALTEHLAPQNGHRQDRHCVITLDVPEVRQLFETLHGALESTYNTPGRRTDIS